MPRHITVTRSNGRVIVTLAGIQHRLSEPAFIELMHAGLATLQALEREREHGKEQAEEPGL